MKNIINLSLWILTLLVVPQMTLAQEFNQEGVVYRVISEDDATVVLHKAHRCVQEYQIPLFVNDYFGFSYRVLEVENQAFRNLSCLHKLDLCGVKRLRDGYARYYEDGAADYMGSFSGCIELHEVTFSDLTYVGDYAFYGCRLLKSLDFQQVEYIGEGAFQMCVDLEKIIMGESMKTVSDQAFAQNAKIRQIEMYAENPPLCLKGAFVDEVFLEAVVSVPHGSKQRYQEAEGWKNFLKIEERGLTGIVEDGIVPQKVSVHADRGVIVVEGATDGELISVWDEVGRLVAVKIADAHQMRISLKRGHAYWLKVGMHKFPGVRL